MIWKFWFIVYVILIAGKSILERILPPSDLYANTFNNNISNFDYILVLIYNFLVFISISYIFALAYKKKLFSINFTKLFTILLVLYNTAIYLQYFYFYYIDALKTASTNFQAIFPAALTSLLSFFPLLLLQIPIIIGIYKYFNKAGSFDKTTNCAWKIFAIYVISISLTWFMDVFVMHYDNILKYNMFDYFACFLLLYGSVFLVGYSYKKKIIPQIFWKATAPIYVIMNILTQFYISDELKQVINYDILKNLWSYEVCNLIMFCFLVYALFKYAYSNKIYEK